MPCALPFSVRRLRHLPQSMILTLALRSRARGRPRPNIFSGLSGPLAALGRPKGWVRVGRRMRAGSLGATRKPHPHTVRPPSSTPGSAAWPKAGRRGRRIAADGEGDCVAEIEYANMHDERKGVAAARGAAATAPKPLLDVDGETVAFAAFRARAGAGTSVLRRDLERPLEAVLALVDQPRQEGVRRLDRVFVDELDYEDHDRLGSSFLSPYSR